MFLYSIKSCHSCAKRGTCNKKNDRDTLIDKPKVFEHVNRGTIRRGMIPVKVESFCKDYVPEEKKEPEILEQKPNIELTKKALEEALKEARDNAKD